jgi:hypothetical protein
MPHYYFDTQDGNKFIVDDEGAELPDLAAAKHVASVSLAELARDVIPTTDRRVLKVEIREDQEPVLETRLIFEAIPIIH